MTYKTFLKELGKLRGQFELAERAHGVRLRTVRTDASGWRCMCPIEAVALALGDKSPYFGHSLKLGVKVRDAIVGGADGHVSGHPSMKAFRRVRSDLLRVLGLKTPKSWK